MASLLSDEPSHLGAPEGNFRVSEEIPEEIGGRWYLSKKEIEDNSPSRRDGIDMKKETYLRKSYCTFLQDLGMRLKVPQVTIATAIIFCHRFFLRQSHAKNDRRTIATVCMFLAGKVEETPRPLKDVILVSYEIIHKKDPAAVQRIKQKDVYEQQKELILLGERVVLGTLGFDLNLLHPYKPLVDAIKKFQVAQNALAQVAWNFVNDGLRTSLCLQFMPHHIAAGAIFLAAKFLKVKLPHDGDTLWWLEFDVTPRQLEEVSNQMLELYEQNRVPPTQASEAEGSAGASQRPPSRGPVNEEHANSTSKASSSKPPPPRPSHDQPHTDNQITPPRKNQTHNNDYGNSEIPDRKGDDEINDIKHHERETMRSSWEMQNKSRNKTEGHHSEDDQESRMGKIDTVELKDKSHGRNLPIKDSIVTQSPQDASKKIDKEKIKAALEKRKARGAIARKVDPEDELERQLEDVEVPVDKRERKPKSSNRDDLDTVEEGELEPSDDVDRGYQSPRAGNRKRKPGSPFDNKQVQYQEDRNGSGRLGYSEREHKRHSQENHVRKM